MSLENDQSKLIIIAGPSCVGKTTIIDQFVQNNPSFKKLITDTTRPPRDNEQNGVDYNFRTFEEFEKLKDNGYYAEVTEYRQNDYKAVARYYFDDLVNGQSYICAITPNIAADFCSHLTYLDQTLLDEIKPRITPIYIGVSSLTTLYRRSRHRQPPIPKIEFKSTLKKDYLYWQLFKSDFPNLILNDTNINDSVRQLENIISTKKPSN